MGTTVRAVLSDPQRSRVDTVSADGHRLAFDARPPDGDGSAMGPKEALLAALAACTAIDVVSILRKKRQRATRYDLVVSGESADEHPRVWREISVEHVVDGDVEPEALRRSIELSATKYCPVSAMLSASVRIEHRYRLVGRDGTDRVALVAVTSPQGTVVA